MSLPQGGRNTKHVSEYSIGLSVLPFNVNTIVNDPSGLNPCRSYRGAASNVLSRYAGIPSFVLWSMPHCSKIDAAPRCSYSGSVARTARPRDS